MSDEDGMYRRAIVGSKKMVFEKERCGWSWRTFEDISILAIFLFCFSPPLHKFWPSWAILDRESDLFFYVVEFGGLWLLGEEEREKTERQRMLQKKASSIKWLLFTHGLQFVGF